MIKELPVSPHLVSEPVFYRADTGAKIKESWASHYRDRRYFKVIRGSSISPMVEWSLLSDFYHGPVVQGIDDSGTGDVVGDPASGVDTVSRTAAVGAPGYRWFQAIMAPIGSANKVRYITPASAAFPWSIDGAGAVPVSSYLTSPDTTVHWWGSGTSTSKVYPEQVYGAIGPVYSNGVQVVMMKPRSLTVVVHPIISEVPGRVDVAPRVVPDQADLQAYLNRIFKKQLNVHLTVTVMPPRKVAWDIAGAGDYPPFLPGHDISVPGDGLLEVNGSSSSVEESPIMGHAIPGNIHVYLIGGGQFRMLKNVGGLMEADSWPKGYVDLTKKDEDFQHVWVDGDRQRREFDGAGNDVTPWEVTDELFLLKIVKWVVAHEIGHLFVGRGHPDRGDGPAPLGFPANDIRHKLRLMCSGDNVDETNPGKQLVAAEWDAAETNLVEVFGQ